MPLGMLEHQVAWGPAGEIGKWVVGNPAVVKIGDSLFVHGGISAAYAQYSPEQINRRVADALKARDEAPTSIINDPAGPLWYRGLISREPGDEATVAPVAANGQQLSIDQEIDAGAGGISCEADRGCAHAFRQRHHICRPRSAVAHR